MKACSDLWQLVTSSIHAEGWDALAESSHEVTVLDMPCLDHLSDVCSIIAMEAYELGDHDIRGGQCSHVEVS